MNVHRDDMFQSKGYIENIEYTENNLIDNNELCTEDIDFLYKNF